ncbi:MAG: hypothetical protein ACI86X_001931 [Moritella sp.]|jgi:hypothetical protein
MPTAEKKSARNLVTGVMICLLLSGCTNIEQFLNQDKAAAQALQVQIEQQNKQIAQLAEQQNSILMALQKQPEYFAKQQQHIAALDSRIESYTQQQLAMTNNQSAKCYQSGGTNSDSNVSTDAKTTKALTNEDSLYTDKIVIGSEEYVWLEDLQTYFKARIDTGATTSSLNATDIIEFERDGKKWVKFNLSNINAEQPQAIEAKIVRTILIRQSNTTETIRRPIIELPVTLGKIKMLTEFTLADRSHMTFPVLLGRTFLKDMVVVDVAKTYTVTEQATL